MVQKAKNWLKENEVAIGLAISLLIYGAGLYQSISEKVSANTMIDAVYQEKVDQQGKRLDNYEATMKEMSDAIDRIDKNVVEIKTEVKYKKDK